MGALQIAFVVDRLGVSDGLSIPVIGALALRDGHHASLFEFGKGRKAPAAIRAFQPDIICFSVCSNEAQRYLEICRLLKTEFPFFALFGGPHPTFSPEYVEQDGADAICRGEGDSSFPRFLKSFGASEMFDTPNFSFRNEDGRVHANPLAPLMEDLDAIPFPARHLIYERSRFLARNPIKAFMASRGCPNSCTYGCIKRYRALYEGKGRITRTKSVAYLIEEILSVGRAYPLRYVKFLDDIFGIDRDWLAEFAEQYPGRVGLPFICYATGSMVTREYADLLKKAGCYAVTVAIECGNEQYRRTVLGKNVSNEQIRQACAYLHERDIRAYTINMVGSPGEDEASIQETIRLNREVHANFATASVFQPYPGTEIFEYCKKNGFCDESFSRFESLYTESVLKISPELRQKTFVLHKLFSALVDYPFLEKILPFFYKRTTLNRLLDLFFRFYFAQGLHRRIFASVVPFRVRLESIGPLFFTRNRT